MRSESDESKIESFVGAMKTDDLLSGLPGEKLARQGLADFRAGLMPVRAPDESFEAELELYRLLKREPGDAYSRYNALIRELTSFENALDGRMRKSGNSFEV